MCLKYWISAVLFMLAPVLRAADLDEADLNARIEKVRKGDLVVRLVDAAGQPITQPVTYRLRRHEFEFGVAIYEQVFTEREYAESMPAYLKFVKEHFNAAAHDHTLKWQHMERERGKHEVDTPLKVLDWADENGITMRGHCIYWNIFTRIPQWTQSLGKEELEQALKSRAAHVFKFFGSRIGEFDVANELLRGDHFSKVLGWNSPAQYFKWCKEFAPEAVLYVNEFDVFWGPQSAKKYVDLIKGLQADGAPIGGIGLQAHFNLKIPKREVAWQALDTLAEFKLPIKITELSISNTADDQQAVSLERLYRLFFAHPAVKGIYLWGFWEGAIFRAESALFRKDWKPRPSGTAMLKLFQEWTTEGQATPDAEGKIKFRGFFGEYGIMVDGKEYVARLSAAKPEATATLGIGKPVVPDAEDPKKGVKPPAEPPQF